MARRSHSQRLLTAFLSRAVDVKSPDTAKTVRLQLPSGREQRPLNNPHLLLVRGRERIYSSAHEEEVEMWQKGAFFCCLSFLLLPSLAHRYWVRHQEGQNPISRMCSLGALYHA